MKGVLLVGKNRDQEGYFGFNLDKAELGLILLIGSTGSGKGITHFHLYSQLMGNHRADELGFVFLDMTRVDFGRWPNEYLYHPVTFDAERALTLFEELGDESIARDEGRKDKKRSIVIHIEECDMIARDRPRFERALLNIVGRKGGNNMLVIFSSSRPSPNVFTKTVLTAADIKIVYQLANANDWMYITRQNLMREITEPGERAVFYQDKMVVVEPFSDAYVRAIENWEASGFANNARPNYTTYIGTPGDLPSYRLGDNGSTHIFGDILSRLSKGIIAGMKLERFIPGANKPTSLKEYQDELWRQYHKHGDRKKAIRYVQEAMLNLPVEQGYHLYYDIAKILGNDGEYFEWLCYACSVLMFNHQIHEKLFTEAKYQSYCKRMLDITGIAHKREEVLEICREAENQKELFDKLQGVWRQRKQPPLPKEPDPLLKEAREYVLKTGIYDPQKLRFNVGRVVIGYNRAVRLIDALEAEGTISPNDNPTWR